jgi:hypothetical protein
MRSPSAKTGSSDPPLAPLFVQKDNMIRTLVKRARNLTTQKQDTKNTAKEKTRKNESTRFLGLAVQMIEYARFLLHFSNLTFNWDVVHDKAKSLQPTEKRKYELEAVDVGRTRRNHLRRNRRDTKRYVSQSGLPEKSLKLLHRPVQIGSTLAGEGYFITLCATDWASTSPNGWIEHVMMLGIENAAQYRHPMEIDDPPLQRNQLLPPVIFTDPIEGEDDTIAKCTHQIASETQKRRYNPAVSSIMICGPEHHRLSLFSTYLLSICTNYTISEHITAPTKSLCLDRLGLGMLFSEFFTRR